MSRAFIIDSESHLSELVKRLYTSYSHRHIWLLEGDLGAGKTTFTKYLAKYLGTQDSVTSPTFSIINEYLIKDTNRYNALIHIDLYRIESFEEVLSLGIEEILDRKDHLKVIEWPERLGALAQEYAHLKVEIQEMDGVRRKFLILEHNT